VLAVNIIFCLSIVPIFYFAYIIGEVERISKTGAVIFPRKEVRFLLFLEAALLCIGGALAV